VSNGGGELLGRIAILIFGVFLLIISLPILAIVSVLHNAQQSKRVEAMNLEARRLGLRHDRRTNRYTAQKFLFLDKFEKRRGRSEHYCLNVVSGKFGGHPVTLFDYHWLSDERVWWWAPSWRRHEYISFIVVNLSKTFPELTLAREGFFSKIAQAIGFDDIDFESAAFSRRYLVRSRDKKFAYDFCNAQMIDYLLDQPTIAIEIEGRALAVGFDSQFRVKEVEPHLSHLLKIRSLMPNYLFEG
jgi:hypothetical protein